MSTLTPPATPRTLTRHLIRRSWLIVLFGFLAGTAAWASVHGQTKIYERTLTFVVLPSPALEPRSVAEAMRGLSPDSSGTMGNIALALGSPGALQQAARSALGRPLSEEYRASPSTPPGSSSVVAQLQGLEPETLATVAPVFARQAVDWVAGNLPAYRLRLLKNEPTLDPVAPKTREMTLLAVFVGVCLAAAISYLEWASAARRSRSTPSAGETTHRTSEAESGGAVADGGVSAEGLVRDVSIPAAPFAHGTSEQKRSEGSRRRIGKRGKL